MKRLTLLQALTHLTNGLFTADEISGIVYESGEGNKFLVTASHKSYYIKLSDNGKLDAMVLLD